jgi:hypothetical protein
MLVLSTLASAASAAGCSDLVFRNAVVVAIEQREHAIDEAYIANYASAKADAFVAWRTLMNAPVPCASLLRSVRMYLVRNMGAVWLSYAAMAAGDVTGAVFLLVIASKDGAIASAELASDHRAGGLLARQPRSSEREVDAWGDGVETRSPQRARRT